MGLLDFKETCHDKQGLFLTNVFHRFDSITRFKNDPSVQIFLISLKAGGVGLNLTRASRVYLLDPYWNPAVEQQAIDRVHRLGQTREVTAVRFIVKSTIEENILRLQKHKLELSKSAFRDENRDTSISDRSKIERDREKVLSLKMLFS